jgi:uncharacterized protein (DUF1778 family)
METTQDKKVKLLNFKCDPLLIERLRQAASLNGQNVSSFVRGTLIDRINQLSQYYPELRAAKKEAA